MSASPTLHVPRALGLSVALTALLGFATLDSDRTRWQSPPSFSIQGQLRNVSDQAAYQATRDAVSSWINIPGGGLNMTEVNANADIPISLIQRWPEEFGEQAAGVTLTYRSNGRISEAEVYINDEGFTWSTADTTPAGDTDLEGVVAHELGHAIGLTHSFHREATMYWSGDDEGMRSLHEDDIRGFRFLYAGANAGQICDTCLSNDDCLSGQCFDFNGPSFCGSSCGPAPNYLCPDAPPERAACFELQAGGTTCLPLTLACSDEAVGVAEEGDYCFGAQHCQEGLICAVTDDDARCVRLGSAQLGEPCDFSALCESELCLPLSSSYAICSEPCDPSAPQGRDCDGECVAVQDPTLRGLCVPAGDVPAGGSCDRVTERCRSGMSCEGGRCFQACEAYGDCPSGLACTPIAGRWSCEPLEGPQEGEACVEGRCGGGLFCLQSQQRCVSPCDPNDLSSCAGHLCLALTGIGICSPGDGVGAEPCEEDFDCLDFSCVAGPEGGALACASLCDQGCPEGWSCSTAPLGERAYCAPTAPEPETGGAETPPPTGGRAVSPPPPSPTAPVGGEGSEGGALGEGSVGSSSSPPQASGGGSCQQAPQQSPPLMPPLVISLCLSYAVMRRRGASATQRGAAQ